MRRIGPAILLVIAAAAPARAADAPYRTLRAAVFLLTERTPASTGWRSDPGLRLVRTPRLAALVAAVPALADRDFGISFDCSVTGGGGLDDCRPVLGIPATVDQRLVVRALAPMVLVDPATAMLARAKGYRVTVDAAAAVFAPPPVPLPPCSGNNCVTDPPPPPSPPPAIGDPLLAFATARAEACVRSAWEPMASALSAASVALRDRAVSTDTAAYRTLALAALRRRQALGACIAELKDLSDRTPRLPGDGSAFDAHYQALLANYRQSDRGLIAVLGGALDRRTGEEEEAFPF